MRSSKPRFRRVTLKTDSLHALGEFYGERLGLPIREDQGELAIQVGNTELVFHESKAIGPTYHFAMNIPENQILGAREWLALRTELLSRNGEDIFDFQSWNAHAVYFRDPAGNIVEFIARHALLNASQVPFGSASLLSISEVGVPVLNVPTSVEQFSQKLGWEPFRDPDQGFAAVGDEEGLAILVQEGRIWFPTQDQSAVRAPIQIELAEPIGLEVTVDLARFQ